MEHASREATGRGNHTHEWLSGGEAVEWRSGGEVVAKRLSGEVVAKRLSGEVVAKRLEGETSHVPRPRLSNKRIHEGLENRLARSKLSSPFFVRGMEDQKWTTQFSQYF